MRVVFGAGGCAKELEWLIAENNDFGEGPVDISFFVAKGITAATFLGKPIYEESDFFDQHANATSLQVFIALANSGIRESVHNRLVAGFGKRVSFPSVIHHSVRLDKREGRFQYGEGNVICAATIVMPDVKIGSFNYISLSVIIGHDTVTGNFVTLFPGVRIAGHVTIGDRVVIGTGAVIIENISICNDVVIGAGSVVAKDITEPGTYVGVPARKIK